MSQTNISIYTCSLSQTMLASLLGLLGRGEMAPKNPMCYFHIQAFPDPSPSPHCSTSRPSPPLKHSQSGNDLSASSGNDSFKNLPVNNEAQCPFCLSSGHNCLDGYTLAEARVATPRPAVGAASLPPSRPLCTACSCSSAHPLHGDHVHESPPGWL